MAVIYTLPPVYSFNEVLLVYCYSNGIESSRMQGWLLIQAHLINVVSLGPNWYPVETGRVYGVKYILKASKLSNA